MGRKKKRRSEKAFSETLLRILGENVSEGVYKTLSKKTGCGYLREDMTNEEAIATALIQRAIDGDTAAAKYICDMAKLKEEKGCEPPREEKIEIVVLDSADEV